jgi:hypothetical protein
MVQSIVKVPRELIKFQQDVEIAIDCFFINKHIFFTTYSTKICFTMVTHLAHHTKAFFGKHSLLHTRCIFCIASELL